MTNLTEQLKKGKLKQGEYWCKITESPYIERVYLPCCDDIIVEVLAPVPSYEEYKQLIKFLEEFNALDVAKENKQLKVLLRECKESVLFEAKVAKETSGKDSTTYKILTRILTKIDEVIGEKK